MTEKRQININITNLDDLTSTLEALDHLFRTIIIHYAGKSEIDKLHRFVLGCATYFGTCLRVLGYDEEDLKDE